MLVLLSVPRIKSLGRMEKGVERERQAVPDTSSTSWGFPSISDEFGCVRSSSEQNRASKMGQDLIIPSEEADHWSRVKQKDWTDASIAPSPS